MTGMITIDPATVTESMMLTELNMGAFRPQRVHRPETEAENARHSTNAARVTVRLTDNEHLVKLGRSQTEARRVHNRLSLPTDSTGVRLLPASRQFEHSEVMRKFKDEHDSLVEKFLSEYPTELADAPARLGTLFDASMWPPVEEVERRFKFRTRYLPAPTQGAWAEWLADTVIAAQEDVRDRLVEALERVRDRCASDGRLHATVFDAIRDLTDLVPDFDLSGSFAPVVAAMQPLAGLHADTLRDDPEKRQMVAKHAEDILSVLGGLGRK